VSFVDGERSEWLKGNGFGEGGTTAVRKASTVSVTGERGSDVGERKRRRGGHWRGGRER